MATTDAALAASAVDALDAAGVTFAFLHKEDEVAEGRVRSDLDVLVDVTPAQLLDRVADRWRDAGLWPVLATEYDVACTTIWLSTRDAEHGVQLDLTYDRAGRSRFGASTRWLSGADVGLRWPVVAESCQRVYRARKAAAKAEPRRIEPVDVARLARRVRRPAGCWVHVPDPADPAELHRLVQAFDRFLPRALLVRPSPARRRAEWVRAARLRIAALRPALLVSGGGPARGAHITLTDRGELAEPLVAALHARCRRQLAGR